MIQRKKYPDKERALNLLQSAKDEISYTLTLKLIEKSTNTIIRNIYESFRMLGESLLINKGIWPIDHLNSINELLKLDVETSRPKYLIENLRKLRHNINYYGYKSNLAEARDAISITKSCFNLMLNKATKIIKGK